MLMLEFEESFGELAGVMVVYYSQCPESFLVRVGIFLLHKGGSYQVSDCF